MRCSSVCCWVIFLRLFSLVVFAHEDFSWNDDSIQKKVDRFVQQEAVLVSVLHRSNVELWQNWVASVVGAGVSNFVTFTNIKAEDLVDPILLEKVEDHLLPLPSSLSQRISKLIDDDDENDLLKFPTVIPELVKWMLNKEFKVLFSDPSTFVISDPFQSIARNDEGPEWLISGEGTMKSCTTKNPGLFYVRPTEFTRTFLDRWISKLQKWKNEISPGTESYQHAYCVLLSNTKQDKPGGKIGHLSFDLFSTVYHFSRSKSETNLPLLIHTKVLNNDQITSSFKKLGIWFDSFDNLSGKRNELIQILHQHKKKKKDKKREKKEKEIQKEENKNGEKEEKQNKEENQMKGIRKITKEEKEREKMKRCFVSWETGEEHCYLVFENYFLDPSCSAIAPDCSLEITTFLKIDSLSHLKDLFSWEGYLSISLYSINFDNIKMEELQEKLNSCGCSCFERFRIHLVLGDENSPFPTNLLRNIAIENGVKEKAILTSIFDIDLAPSHHLCQLVQQNILKLNLPRYPQSSVPTNQEKSFNTSFTLPNITKSNVLLIVPTFEFDTTPTHYPFTKEQIFSLFEVENLHFYPQHSSSFNFEKWKRVSSSFLFHPINLYDDHFLWFSWIDYFKSPFSFEPICDERFSSSEFDHLICYLNLRLRGFVPVLFTRGWLFHKIARSQEIFPFVDEKNGQKQSLTSFPKQKKIKDNFKYYFCNTSAKLGWGEKILECTVKKCINNPITLFNLKKCYQLITQMQQL